MTHTDHLLWILAEECAEVAHRCSKAARFSLAEVQPGQSLTNAERIVQEYVDAKVALKMLIESGAIKEPSMGQRMAWECDKRVKIERFLLLSAANGRLDIPAPTTVSAAVEKS